MQPQDYKDLINRIRVEFSNILENCYTEFYLVDLETAVGQVFSLEIFYAEQYLDIKNKPIEDVNIVRSILHFQAKGEWKNSELDINKFFLINDDFFNELFELSERGYLNPLITILKYGRTRSITKNIGQSSVDVSFFLTIESTIKGGNQFLRNLLSEGVATIGLNESNEEEIEVSISLYERKRITALMESIPTNLLIPFDKVAHFKMFEKETENIIIDNKYIFVAMSFKKDPHFEDSYNAIKRSVKSLKKGILCQRVDDIQDDFVISDKIIDCIKKCKVLIVDLTDNRPNVYYELGFARAIGKHIVLIAKGGEKPHFDVSHQNTIFYENTTTLEKALRTRLLTVYKNI